MKSGEPISIANIRLDGGTQPRAALNVNAIEDYAKAMSAGAKFPPVAVFYDGEHYWLADGFHRIKAGCAAGLSVIDCEIHQGTVEDAQWYSFSANKANGLRRTNSDKQRAVKAALAHPRSGSLSNSEIGTTEEWERERFDILNMRRTKLSPNVLLRNRAAQCPSLRHLHDLCTDESFVLCQRVSWSQYMRREELLTALSFLKTVMRLHSKFGAGRYHAVSGLWQALPPMMASVGHTTMIENVKTFFELLEGTWGIRGILYKDRATHLKHGFLFALADVISAHPSFWSGKSLRIDRDMQKKIGQFGLNDPSVRVMACSGSSVGLLNRLIVDHINSGRRTRRLAAPEPNQGGARRDA